jgi:chromosome segregation ATPase
VSEPADAHSDTERGCLPARRTGLRSRRGIARRAVLSSKNEGKHDARFEARIDALAERVDTLASTIATTASAIAKKDGEIAALQRAFESRDETLRALVQHVNRAAEAPATDAPVDATELRSLRNAIAALTKERASGVNASHLESVIDTVRALAERVDALSAAAAAPPVPTTDPATTARIDALTADLAVVRTALDRPPEQLVAMLSTLRDRVDGLAAELEAGVTEEQVDRRFGQTDHALENAAHRLDALAAQMARLEGLFTVVGGLEQTRNADAEQIDRRLEATDAALAKLSQGLDALAERLGGLESTRVAHEERLDHRLGKTSVTLTTLSQRLDALRGVDEARIDRRFGETDEALASLAQRLDGLGETLGQLERARAAQEERLVHRFGTTSDTLATLSQRLDALQGVDQAHFDRRLGETDDALATFARRLDALAATVESAAAGLGAKENELEVMHRNFTDSSTRIESIVNDIREALHALPEPSSTSLDELSARLERTETATREATETSAHTAGELSGRIDVIDQRVATVAEDVSRAKTLWPVALRSLEARLDDAVHGRRPEPGADVVSNADAADEPADDLLAGLRNSLQAMETVAAEMARASETLGEPSEEPPAVDVSTPPAQPEQPPAAAAGGATVVPLRSGEP